MKKFLLFVSCLLIMILPIFAVENDKIDIFTKSINKQNSNIIPNFELSELYTLRAFIYEKELSDEKNALIDYKQAIKYNSKNQDALFKISAYKIKYGDYEGALQDVNRILEINPNNANMHYIAATLYGKLKQTNNAIKECTNALKIQNKYPEAFKYRGLCEISIGHYDKGYKDLNYAKQQFYEQNDIEHYKEVVSLINTLSNKNGTKNTYTIPTVYNNYEAESQLKQLNNNLQNINHTLYTMPY